MIKGNRLMRRYLKLKQLWATALIRHDITAARVFQTEWELLQ